MIKQCFLLFMLLPFLGIAQFQIKGKLDSEKEFTWILLYKIENGKPIYLQNAEVNQGAFSFTLDASQPAGIYRLYYELENQLFVELLYNKENINFIFSPENPLKSLKIISSDENKIYQNYYNAITQKQRKLDSLQVAYFQSTDAKTDKKIKENYLKIYDDLALTQTTFEKETNGMLANHLVQVDQSVSPKTIIKSPEVYLSEVKKHFFDSVDFQDRILLNSTYINDKIIDYIFYLNQSNDHAELVAMQKESIQYSLDKIGDNYAFKKNIIEQIINEYVQLQNGVLVNYMIENHYQKLPNNLQDSAFVRDAITQVKTSIGQKAPNITWSENGEEKSLYGLSSTEYYAIVFFSSTCSHCQVEIPQFYNFIKNLSNIQVIAIGLEDEKTTWENMVKDFPKFINVLDLDKWDSPRADAYGVTAIPTYFILDKDKNIIAKPEDFPSLKALFTQE